MGHVLWKRRQIYDAANLSDEEVQAVEAVFEADPTESDPEMSGFTKLQKYFCDSGEMPYAIATQSSWHPENTSTPDDWIITRIKDWDM